MRFCELSCTRASLVSVCSLQSPRTSTTEFHRPPHSTGVHAAAPADPDGGDVRLSVSGVRGNETVGQPPLPLRLQIVKWFWQDQDGSWRAYDPDHAGVLETEWQRSGKHKPVTLKVGAFVSRAPAVCVCAALRDPQRHHVLGGGGGGVGGAAPVGFCCRRDQCLCAALHERRLCSGGEGDRAAQQQCSKPDASRHHAHTQTHTLNTHTHTASPPSSPRDRWPCAGPGTD
jgi:hypothetical protein